MVTSLYLVQHGLCPGGEEGRPGNHCDVDVGPEQHLGARDVEGPDDALEGPPEGGQLPVQQHAAPLHVDVGARGGGAEVQQVDEPCQ